MKKCTVCLEESFHVIKLSSEDSFGVSVCNKCLDELEARFLLYKIVEEPVFSSSRHLYQTGHEKAFWLDRNYSKLSRWRYTSSNNGGNLS